MTFLFFLLKKVRKLFLYFSFTRFVKQNGYIRLFKLFICVHFENARMVPILMSRVKRVERVESEEDIRNKRLENMFVQPSCIVEWMINK